jgi:hypothetical protein
MNEFNGEGDIIFGCWHLKETFLNVSHAKFPTSKTQLTPLQAERKQVLLPIIIIHSTMQGDPYVPMQFKPFSSEFQDVLCILEG